MHPLEQVEVVLAMHEQIEKQLVRAAELGVDLQRALAIPHRFVALAGLRGGKARG
jgi:hypothetical protein